MKKTKKIFGPTPLAPYSIEVETFMKQTYANLSEKDRRLYAAIEAIKLGRGGIHILQSFLVVAEIL